MRVNGRFVASSALAVLFFLQMSQLANGSERKAGRPPSADDAQATVEFGLPKPRKLQRRMRLWATHYYVYGDVQSTAAGQPLLDLTGKKLGPLLSERDWCLGGVEGTIRVVTDEGTATVYNFAGKG